MSNWLVDKICNRFEIRQKWSLVAILELFFFFFLKCRTIPKVGKPNCTLMPVHSFINAFVNGKWMFFIYANDKSCHILHVPFLIILSLVMLALTCYLSGSLRNCLDTTHCFKDCLSFFTTSSHIVAHRNWAAWNQFQQPDETDEPKAALIRLAAPRRPPLQRLFFLCECERVLTTVKCKWHAILHTDPRLAHARPSV